MDNDTSARVAWVDYAKGICIVAVVALYATMYVDGLVLERNWMSRWIEFAQPIRMPAFFLISGLFLARTIDRPWRDYLDKKVLHFGYFFILWTSLYFIAGVMTGEFDGGAPLWVDYLDWYVEPFHMLWFIQMLPIYFLVTRLVRRAPWAIVMMAATLLEVWAPESGWRQLDRFGERFIYFYAGYLFAPLAFHVADWARQNRAIALAVFASWITVNEISVLSGFAEENGVRLLLGFAGAAGVIILASLLTGLQAMDWLRHVGQQSIVVFLSFFVVVVVCARILHSTGAIGDAGTLTLLVTIASVLVPMVGCRLLQPTPLRFLFERPAWAKISGGRRALSPADAPSIPQVAAGIVAPVVDLTSTLPRAVASVYRLKQPHRSLFGTRANGARVSRRALKIAPRHAQQTGTSPRCFCALFIYTFVKRSLACSTSSMNSQGDRRYDHCFPLPSLPHRWRHGNLRPDRRERRRRRPIGGSLL